ncbi:MAG: hypothetical protein IJ180_04090, partial [Bacteroidales bacterium]|nr:hypothetical protein [Bacteroidales bacterium]
MKKFRKIPIILTLAGLTLFIACNNDDDEPEKKQKHNVEIILNGSEGAPGLSESLRRKNLTPYQ